MQPGDTEREGERGWRVRSWLAALILCGLLATAGSGQSAARSSDDGGAGKAAFRPRRELPPRKVLVATCVQGFYGAYPGLEKRLEELRDLVEEMAAQAEKEHPGKGLDLVVLPENAVTIGRAPLAADRAVPFAGAVAKTFSELARRFRTYLAVPLDIAEGTEKKTCYNAVVLLDRAGRVAGTYRKVHPVAPLGEESLEGGITPGREHPVFQCDFGRLGIQICYDMVYDDGWAELERKGADLVIWPSASPATAQPAGRARQHGYYIVSSTYRDNAAIFEPTGLITAQVKPPARVLLRELDLSYALVPWSSGLGNGSAFRKRFGERAGFRYYPAEDIGIFWSNDPSLPIGEMLRQLGIAEAGEDIERNRRIQDAARPADR
jgi:predicted amidohydrolase